MATPTPKRTKPNAPDVFARYPPRPPRTGPPDLVDPRFLLKAFGATVLAAMVLAYLSVCLLVYIGGWHRLLHPSPVTGAIPTAPGLTVQQVRFGATGASGRQPLTGWWIPSDSSTAPTILYLHDENEALRWSPDLELLHEADVNVFAIDYRGYGQSDGPHPTQARMQEDAAVALDSLLYTRHVPAAKIVPYGVGLGSVLAANLAATHPELPALIVDQPWPDAYFQAVDAQQSRLLPMHLLVRDHFDIAAALAEVHQPKLLMASEAGPSTPDRGRSVPKLFRDAPIPKYTIFYPTEGQPVGPRTLDALHRFLDQAVR